MKILTLLIVVSTTFGAVLCTNTAKLLADAVKNLAVGIDEKNPVPEVLPNFSDLAISRLQADTLQVVDDVWKIVSNQNDRVIYEHEPSLHLKVIEMYSILRNDIFALAYQISESNIENELRNLAVPQDEVVDWNRVFYNLLKLTGKIGFHYGILDEYMANPNSTSRIILEDYARSIIQPGSTQAMAILTTIDQLNEMIVPEHDDKGRLIGGERRRDLLFRLYSTFKVNRGEMCSLAQTPRQLVLNLYNYVALAEVKAYVMVQFSYVVFKIFDRADLQVESDLARRNFVTNQAYKISFAKEVLDKVSDRLWMCDPKVHREGATYLKLVNFLQGHLENEVDMNSLGSCRDNCAAFKVAEPKKCFGEMFCAKQRPCNGRLFDCQFFHADAWVCMSDSADRKYDWIEYEDGTRLGTKGKCDNRVKVDSWWRFLFHCSYCLCKCDAPGPDSDAFWSLDEQLSDVVDNRVVTGVRFAKRGRVLHVEIEEGRALPEGLVNPLTRRWKLSAGGNVNVSVESDASVMRMSYEQRAVDTDHVVVPAGHVVTGVRMRNLGGHLNLEVRMTPIDFRRGKVDADRSTWVGNDNTPATADARARLHISDPDVPTKFAGRSKVDSAPNQYLLFDSTSALKDVSQTTIPFIDAQAVSPVQGSWLSGVGLYHKGAKGYGGYIGLAISTYDVSRHLVAKRAESVYNIDF